MANATLAQFKATAATLNTCELAGAYKALYENNAPMQCLEVILDRIVDEEGLEFAEGLIEELV